MTPRVHYFLVRPEQQILPGTTGLTRAMVPLIPVDLLPGWMEIAGVPRTLTLEQTGGMSSLGTILKDEEIFDVRLHRETLLLMLRGGEVDAESTPRESTPRGGSNPGLPNVDGAGASEGMVAGGSNQANVVNSNSDYGTEFDRSTNAPARAVTDMAQPAEGDPSEHMHGATCHAAGSFATQPADAAAPETFLFPRADPQGYDKAESAIHQLKNRRGIAPPRSSRNCCRHWCHHGSCKWGLLCRYQHNMPMTLAGLQEVGLKDFPRWWTTAMGLTLAGALGTGGLSRMGAFGATNNKETRKMRDFMTSATQAHLQQQLTATRAGAGTVDPRACAEASILDEAPPETVAVVDNSIPVLGGYRLVS